MSPDDGSVRTIACPACGGTIAMRAAGYTVTLACEYCGTLIDAAHPDARIITRYHDMQATLAIPLGTRGTLRGVEWEAIGWMQRTDGWADWEEFLLFNPYAGYRWLIAQNGQWSFGRMLTAVPQRRGSDMIVDGRLFSRFYHGNVARVTRVAGEFYWRVKIGEEVRTSDYVRPGHMLSLEHDDREKNWTVGELLSGQEICAAFAVASPPMWLPGITPLAHQPSPFARRLKGWGPVAILSFIALLAMLVIFGRTMQPQGFAMTVTPDGPAISQTFGPIVLPMARQAMTVEVTTPGVEQGWVDVDVSFVDRSTQDSYDAYALNERYSGRDSDGYWSEGSRSQTLKVASLPAGTYDLVIDAQAHHWGGGSGTSSWSWDQSASSDRQPVELNLTVARGAQFASNFWMAAILILVPPLLMLILHIMFENARLVQKDDAAADADDWLKGMETP
ncbi:DUF4178 domain-containing protein [Sphingobium sp.]|uniref:DUF4178 domain-containing protein n=1 Tax=Sphingobium sp. TaxID=1912891 RepID=UPI003B3B9723